MKRTLRTKKLLQLLAGQQLVPNLTAAKATFEHYY